MMRGFRGLRPLGVALILVVVAACSSAEKPELSGEPAVPGSERDFVVNVGDRVFFPTDQSSLTDAAKETLRRQAAWLKLYPHVTVRVEGHADERGTRESNLALSARRAAATQAYLVSQGVDPSRIDTISFGKERPVALCDAESCWSQNRRAVTVITAGAAAS